MIHFACPTCKNQMQVPEESCGTKLNCSVCGQRIQVPRPVPAVPSSPAPNAPKLEEPQSPPGAAASPSQNLVLLVGALGAGVFLLAGMGCGLYILLSATGKGQRPTDSRGPVTQAADPVIERPVPHVPAPLPELPPEKFTLSDLYSRFQRDPSDVKRTLRGTRIAVDLENRTWEVENLQSNADGVIEIVAYRGNAFRRENQLILRFSQSKDKIVSRMQQYAESRKRGETVHFVVTGKLGTTRQSGVETLVLNDVSLE